MHRVTTIPSALLFVSACVGAPTAASANIFDAFGAGPRAQAMAGAATATVADYTAAFTNPAALPDSPQMLSFGMTGTFNRTSILLMRRPTGYDPPGYGLRQRPRSDTEDPRGALGLTTGFAVHLFSDDFALGAMIFAPMDGFANTSSWFGDEREQRFSNRLHPELMGDRLRNEVFAVSLGYRFRPWLSMGIGFLVLPGVSTVTNVYTPNAADPSRVDLNVKLEQSARRALNVGLLIRPTNSLRIGINLQDELFFSVNGYSDVQLAGEEGTEPPRQDIDLVGNYSPPRLTGSVAWVEEGLGSVTLEATFNAWSNYLDNHGQRAGFDDTVDFKIGAEIPVGTAKARFGLSWLPSPVPDQTGRTNYADTDRIGLGLGGGRDFELLGEDITLDFSLQVQALRTRRTRKALAAGYPACADGEVALCDEVPDLQTDTPLVKAAETRGLQTGNPGFPGFTQGGYVVTSGVDLKWRF